VSVEGVRVADGGRLRDGKDGGATAGPRPVAAGGALPPAPLAAVGRAEAPEAALGRGDYGGRGTEGRRRTTRAARGACTAILQATLARLIPPTPRVREAGLRRRPACSASLPNGRSERHRLTCGAPSRRGPRGGHPDVSSRWGPDV